MTNIKNTEGVANKVVVYVKAESKPNCKYLGSVQKTEIVIFQIQNYQ